MYPDDSLTLHTDLYQINMMQVYFDQGIHNKKAVFEVYQIVILLIWNHLVIMVPSWNISVISRWN